MITSEKTADKNVVKKIETQEDLLRIDTLEKEISDLETEIANSPKIKTKPDQETLDFWNGMNVDLTEGMANELKEKQDLLKKMQAVITVAVKK